MRRAVADVVFRNERAHDGPANTVTLRFLCLIKAERGIVKSASIGHC